MSSNAQTPVTPLTPQTPRTPGFYSRSPTIKRIFQEAAELSRSADPSLVAAPLDTNLFEWHFTITGPPNTAYELGLYHGRIILPPSYPLRPPSFRFLTPSGRFEVNREICLSISGHHEETWQPAWGIRTALCAIRAFMASDAKGQIGGLEVNDDTRRLLAKSSRAWKCVVCNSNTNEDIVNDHSKPKGEADTNGISEAGTLEAMKELKVFCRDDPPDYRTRQPSSNSSEDFNCLENSGRSNIALDVPNDRSLGAPTISETLQSQLRNQNLPKGHQHSGNGNTWQMNQEQRKRTPSAAKQQAPKNLNSGLWLIDAAIIAVALTLGIMVIKRLLV